VSCLAHQYPPDVQARLLASKITAKLKHYPEVNNLGGMDRAPGALGQRGIVRDLDTCAFRRSLVDVAK